MNNRYQAYCDLPVERDFECFFNFLGWWQWSLGFHVDLRHPHIDIHVPFGYIRIGWFRTPTLTPARRFGYSAVPRKGFE